MSNKINTIKLLKILDVTPPEQNIMLCGKHGIGKFQIITDDSSNGITNDYDNLKKSPDRRQFEILAYFVSCYGNSKDVNISNLFIRIVKQQLIQFLNLLMNTI